MRHWKKVPVQITSPRPKGWLPPSIQSKIDHHIHLIQRYHNILPLKTKHTIEVARFDIQRMKDPNVHGEIYQKGRLYDYENAWAYVLAKYKYKCPICGHKFDNDHKARKHHLTYRKFGATDNPDEIAPVCSKCHTGENHLEGKPLDKLRKVAKSRKEYREPTFMNILRHRLLKAFPEDQFTYGNITSADRKTLGLSKTHANDAVAIAMCQCQSKKVKDCGETIYYKQVRRKKRSLHEATPRKGRKEPNKTAVRNCKNVKSVNGFILYDTVLYNGMIGFISGFSETSAYVVDFNGEYIMPKGKAYKQISLSKLKCISHRTNNYISKVV